MRIGSNLPLGGATPTPAAKAQESGEDFGRMLMDVISEVNESQANAREIQNQMIAGQPVEYHELMFAVEKSSTAMALTLQVRNKLLEAYQEISRMQV